MTFLITALVVIVAVAAAGVGAIAMRQKRSFAKANEIVPGRTTGAPAAWAGAHSPEAKMHRRLAEAVAALRANPTLSDGAFMESRAGIEQAAHDIDDRLIAAAALPRGHRESAIAAVEPDVAALEASVASLAKPVAGGTEPSPALDDSVRSAQMRLDALADARAELEAVDPAASAHQATIEQVEAARRQPAESPAPAQPQARSQPQPRTQPPSP